MLGTFAKLKAAIKLKLTKVRIDTPVFRLHYRLTFIFLVACCILVTARQYFGEHISCIQDANAIPAKVINNYCFISSTFSVPNLYGSKVGSEVPHPGMGPYTKKEDVKHHAYYQWVPFVLFIQALMFYAPYALWKAWEGDKIDNIIQGLNVFTLKEKDSRQKKEDILATYLVNNLHEHNSWALRFFFCELLNLMNVIGQIFFTDFFLGGEFLRYGIEVVQFLDLDPEQRMDPMARVFPRMTKCTFHTFGSSGTIQRHDALCILALNIVNEKIYTFIWFWFIILSVISALSLMYRLMTIVFTPSRTIALRTRLPTGLKDDVDLVVQKCQVGDWLVLEFLGKNMDTIVFGSLINKFAKLLSYGLDRSGEGTPILT